MKIKIGKLETSHYRLQLKFAGLESLMTEDLQQQLIPHATNYNRYQQKKDNQQLNEMSSHSKENDQLAKNMSNLMKQPSTQEVNTSKNVENLIIKKIKQYV